MKNEINKTLRETLVLANTYELDKVKVMEIETKNLLLICNELERYQNMEPSAYMWDYLGWHVSIDEEKNRN
ncbi:MAG TPA: hypothetical protein ACHBX0_13545 [Arsenophonus sp.]